MPWQKIAVGAITAAAGMALYHFLVYPQLVKATSSGASQ